MRLALVPVFEYFVLGQRDCGLDCVVDLSAVPSERSFNRLAIPFKLKGGEPSVRGAKNLLHVNFEAAVTELYTFGGIGGSVGSVASFVEFL